MHREATAEHSACSRARALLGSCLVLLAASCGKHEPAAQPPPVVSVALVEQKDVPVYSEYVGTLDAYVNAEARARVQGILLEQHYTEGTYVKAGQLLFVIDPKPYEARSFKQRGRSRRPRPRSRRPAPTSRVIPRSWRSRR